MPILTNFVENIRAALAKSKMTKTEIAERAGVHRVTIHKILSGEIEPSLELCEKIADGLGFSPPEKIFQKIPRRARNSA